MTANLYRSWMLRLQAFLAAPARPDRRPQGRGAR